MKCRILLVLSIAVFLFTCGCSVEHIDSLKNSSEKKEEEVVDSKVPDRADVKITVGEQSYIVKMNDYSASRELLERLPLTVEMRELNGNEKYYYFTTEFSSEAKQVEYIEAGELMLYGSDCIVLFYKDHPTTYSYTKLGKIEDISGLTDAVGRGNVTMTFERISN